MMNSQLADSGSHCFAIAKVAERHCVKPESDQNTNPTIAQASAPLLEHFRFDQGQH
jgi:hypothetical protein